MNEQWKFKSLTPEEVNKRLISAHERLLTIGSALRQVTTTGCSIIANAPSVEDPVVDGAIHILKDAGDVIAEVYCDIEKVDQKEAPTDHPLEGQ